MPATKYYLLLLLVLRQLAVWGQVSESFTDGDFTQNPVWTGTDSFFTINGSLQLQSKVTGGGIAWLSTQHKEVSVWQAWFRMAFNPSSQNMARWYLSASDSVLNNAVNSIYVQLGGSTGNTDSISLWKVNGGQRRCLIQGRAGTLGKSNNIFNVRVIYQHNQWQLYTDTSAQNMYQWEGMCADTGQLYSYTGFWFKCTSGNAGNFYADDIDLHAWQPDTLKPFLTEAYFVDSLQLNLHFSEPVQQKQNSIVSINQDTLLMGRDKPDSYHIRLNNKPLLNAKLTIHLRAVTDTAGNMLDTVFEMVYHPLQQHDVLITELMPDPDPSLGLPLAEYAELYNASSQNLILRNMQWCDAQTCISLPPLLLPANEYLLLCAAKDSSAFLPFGNVCALSYWPSLNNTSDSMRLMLGNQSIHTLAYTDSWYQNPSKAGGGYSLEMMNPLQLCTQEKNWIASAAAVGGTPGKSNSLWQVWADTVAPGIEAVWNTNAFTVCVKLTEAPLHSELADFSLNPFCRINHFRFEPDKLLYILELTDSLNDQVLYTLQVNNITDCTGNKLVGSKNFEARIAREAAWNDVLIHEVFSDLSLKSQTTPAQFVELYNRCNYAIQLKGFTLSDAYTSALLPEYLLLPHSCVVLCASNADSLFNNEVDHIALAHFPSLNLSDCLWLRNASGYQIHQLCYEQNWFTKTARPNSRSLEMANANMPCAGAENWQASLHPNGATPARLNSVGNSLQDHESPQLLRWFTPAADELVLLFNESTDSNTFRHIRFEPETEILQHGYYKNNNHYAWLRLKHFPLPDTLLQLNTDSLQDCVANISTPYTSESFSYPQTPVPSEICINEVLFNPKPQQTDYIELRNNANRTLSLDSLYLINAAGIPEIYKASEEGLILLPHALLVLTEDPDALVYPQLNVQNIIACKLPSLPDDEGILMLRLQDGTLIDSFAYSEKQHVTFLSNAEGVSLEKINPYQTSWSANNWTSAAEATGWGTPTYENSAMRQTDAGTGFNMHTPYFSPDGDGYLDFASFSYTLAQTACTGTLRIYDLQGQCIKTIANHMLLGAQGSFYWHGDTDYGAVAPVGNYLVYWELQGANNTVSSKKYCLSLTNIR